MKKITLTSILALCMACPAFANIDKDASTATCNNATIGTTTGPANLQADWTANTIHLDWYSNDTKQTSTTCTYDGGITLPSTPTIPTGYTFGGWKVRASAANSAQTGFDLSTLAQYINEGEDGRPYAYIDNNGLSSTVLNESKSPEAYGLTTAGEWATEFSYGTIKGIASCNSTSGNANTWDEDENWNNLLGNTQPSNMFSNNNVGGHCWCQVTGFDAEKDGSYLSVSNPSWIFLNNVGDMCSSNCAGWCQNMIQVYGNFRRAAYGIN